MTAHVVKPLTPETFPAWLALAEKHNGVWGGCYCSYFHGDTEQTQEAIRRADVQEATVTRGSRTRRSSSTATRRSRGASTAVRRAAGHLPSQGVRRGEANPAPWRITCFFVDRDHRRTGVAMEALDGALELIAQAGGGEVVSFPNELEPGKRMSSSFLHNVTRAMFEEAGFTFERQIGKSKTVMRKTVRPARG